MGEDGMNQRLQRATVLQALQVKRSSVGSAKRFPSQKLNTTFSVSQDSLHQLLENPRWQSRKGDFAVVMQSSPVILESQSPAVSYKLQYKQQ